MQNCLYKPVMDLFRNGFAKNIEQIIDEWQMILKSKMLLSFIIRHCQISSPVMKRYSFKAVFVSKLGLCEMKPKCLYFYVPVVNSYTNYIYPFTYFSSIIIVIEYSLILHLISDQWNYALDTHHGIII